MLQRSFKIFLVISSLTGCGSGPRVDVCISDGSKGMDCVTPKKKEYFVKYADTENYVCLSPDDFKVFRDWAELKCKE